MPARADGNQFFFLQCHHIYWFYLREQTEVDPANMGCYWKIYCICIFTVALRIYCGVYHKFSSIIGNQFCPDFLFDKIRFIAVVKAQSDRIFELSKRCFYSPSEIINFFDFFRRKWFIWKICYDTFIWIFRYGKPYNAKFFRLQSIAV